MTPDTFFMIFIHDYELNKEFVHGPYTKASHADHTALDSQSILLILNNITHNNWQGEVVECILSKETIEVINVRGEFSP
jgi:hypothetical protein